MDLLQENEADVSETMTNQNEAMNDTEGKIKYTTCVKDKKINTKTVGLSCHFHTSCLLIPLAPITLLPLPHFTPSLFSPISFSAPFSLSPPPLFLLPPLLPFFFPPPPPFLLLPPPLLPFFFPPSSLSSFPPILSFFFPPHPLFLLSPSSLPSFPLLPLTPLSSPFLSPYVLIKTFQFLDNSQRKYPRKQDKKLIKRTIRELENDSLLSPEGKVNVNSLYTPPRQDEGKSLISPEMQRSCKHPIYVCKNCHAEFPNTNGRVFKCVDCRRGFYTEADLNQHMVRAKHNNLCAVCGKIFPDKYKLRKHELSHVTEKNFRCEEPGCTKSFKSAEDVRTHVRYVHAVEKRFHCTHCSKAFTRLDKFKLHMNTHGISLKPGPVSPSHTAAMQAIGSNPVGSNALVLKTSPVEETPGGLALYHSAPNGSGVQTVGAGAGDANSHLSPVDEHNTVSSEVDVVPKSNSLQEDSTVVPYSSSTDFTNR